MPPSPAPSPEEFWKLLAASRLVAGDVLDGLRREFERAAAGRKSDDGDAATAIAKWLVHYGVLSKWQGRRLLSGDSGPFFIGDYRLVDRLESDGPGRLFRGRHEPSGRRVCLMLLDRKLCQRVDVWTEVVRRTTIANEAADPVLSRTWALEQTHGNRFIVCEDVEGVALADELARLGPLPPAEALRLMLPVVAAVAELHRRGAVHGSLSLDAVRREAAAAGAAERSGRVRLLQIPLAGDPHAVPAQTPIDATERVSTLGRRASFVAPELMLPGRFADVRSDVYALGCMLHALLTGVPPCWQGDAQRTLSHAAFVGPPPLGPPQVPVEVATLVAYMVARDPAGRYADAAEAADAIALCLGLRPVSPTLPAPQRAAAAAGTVSTGVAVGALPSAVGPTPVFPTPGRPAAGAPAAAADRSAAAARGPSHRLRTIGLGIAGGLVLLTLAIVLWRSGGDGGGAPDEETGTVADATEERPRGRDDRGDDGKESEAAVDRSRTDRLPPDRSPPAPQVEIVAADDLPWASPTTGRPPTLAFLPVGAQLVLLVRPGQIVADEEGRLFVRSLGPAVSAGIAVLESLCGRGLADIEELQAGWVAGEQETDVGVGWTVRFREPSPLAEDADARRTAWGETEEEQVGEETIHRGERAAFWLPEGERGRVLVIGPAAVVAEMVAAHRPAGGKSADDAVQASLPQDLEQLVGMLDRSRHLTLFGSPHYLANDGGSLLAPQLAGLVDPLERFFGSGVKAAALSLHFGDNFYAEVDAIATRAEQPKPLALRLARELDGLADRIEDAVAALDPHPYGRKLVLRLPTMLGVLAANARVGAEGKAVVINAYLPRHAGHNLVLASELALEQSRAGGGSTAVARAAPRPGASGGKPASPGSPLEKRMSLVFAKDTLEKSIQMVSDEIGMPMEILGGDLQLEGITKNQSFGLEERDKPAGEILRTILARSDTAGRLVYVVRSRDGVESVEITTRAAVEKRGDTLPAAFAAGESGATKPQEEPKR